VTQKQTLDDDAENTHRHRRKDEREPVVHAERLHRDVRGERAKHVERAMRKIHDPEEPEDDRQPETEKRVERPIDQAQGQLTEDRGQRNAEHGKPRAHAYFLTKEQAGSGCVPSASSPGMTLITL
jgi:hypothetical protein